MRTLEIASLALVTAAATFSATTVIPKPAAHEPGKGVFVLGTETSIITASGADAAAQGLAADLRAAAGYPLPVYESGTARDSAIYFRIDRSASAIGREGYRLDIQEKRITVEAGGPAGAFYAGQTLRQLLPPEVYSARNSSDVTWSIPCGRIEDRRRGDWSSPRYSALSRLSAAMASPKMSF